MTESITKANARTTTSHLRERTDLTAVTLGEILKENLDQVVAATGENRSKIIRDALERYLAELPELRKHREELREKVHNRAFLILFSRVLDSFHLLLVRTFGFRDVFPVELERDLLRALDNFRGWLEPHVPKGADLQRELSQPVSEALFEIERGSKRMWFSTNDTKWWTDFVDRWRRELKQDKSSKK